MLTKFGTFLSIYIFMIGNICFPS